MIKLIWPNPFLEDVSYFNLDVEKNKHLCLTPTNFRSPPIPYWASFAIESGFESIDISEDYFIVLQGSFNDSVTIRVDSNDRISLNKDISDYRIPISGKDLRCINIEGSADDPIVIERLSIEHKDYEIPSKKKKIYFIKDPCNPNTLRKGEKNILDFIEIVNEVDDETVVYVRPTAELVKKTDIEKIEDELKQIRSSTKARIVNDIQYFYNHNIKNFTFGIWNKNGIPCPEWSIINSKEDVEKFLDKYERCVLRINNSWGGRNSHAITKKSNYVEILKQLDDFKNKQIEEGFEHVDIIVSRKILPIRYDKNLILNVGRSFVVNGKILNTHSFVHQMNDFECLTGGISSDENFIEAHRRIQKIENDYYSLIVEAVESLRISVGCVDFLIEDNHPIFLEVNAYWGMGLGLISYPYSPRLKKYLLDNKEVYKDINNIYRRMDQYNIWKEFYKEI